jgi:hypothetical protein
MAIKEFEAGTIFDFWRRDSVVGEAMINSFDFDVINANATTADGDDDDDKISTAETNPPWVFEFVAMWMISGSRREDILVSLCFIGEMVTKQGLESPQHKTLFLSILKGGKISDDDKRVRFTGVVPVENL